MDDFTVEYSGLESLEILLSHRMQMWKEIYPNMSANDEKFSSLTREWLEEKLGDKTMVAILVKDREGKIAGSGCILIQEDQPRPNSIMIRRPYLLSMYTEKNLRRMGVATIIVKNAIKWARDHGFDRMTLHASETGKSLYEKMGFRQTNEMRLLL